MEDNKVVNNKEVKETVEAKKETKAVETKQVVKKPVIEDKKPSTTSKLKETYKTSKTAVWVAVISFAIAISALAILIGFFTADVGSDSFHPGLPELQLSIATFIGTLISFVIVFLLTYKFLWNPMNKHLDKRRENIQGNIKEAEKSKKEAKKLFDIANIEVEKSKDSAKDLFEEAKKEASVARRELLAQAKEESDKMIQRSREQIEKEKALLEEDIKKEILETSFLAAEKIIEKEITSADNTKMIEELIKTLEK